MLTVVLMKARFEASGGPVVEDSLLEGHLNVMKELLAFKTSEERRKIGSAEGQGLINVRWKDGWMDRRTDGQQRDGWMDVQTD